MKGATVVTVLRRMGNSPPATERTFRTATERRSIPQAIRARLEAIHERRAIAGRMTAGVAAYSDSDMFKDSQSTNIAKAKRWDGHFSKECLARHPCILKQAAKHLKQPNLISLGGGLPSPSYFPLSKLSLKLASPPSFEEGDAKAVSMAKFDMTEEETGGGGRQVGAEYDLSVALNYGQAQGSAQMLRWITEHIEITNNPKYGDWWCSASSGSTGAFEIAVRMFCNGGLEKEEAERDKMLVEEYSFSTAVETLEALGVTAVPVKMDGEGIVPEDLERIISEWDEKKGRRPHVLYTVPTGQNPTGATQSDSRRKEVYGICDRHDLFIIEDDPYYFLTMPPYPTPASKPTSESTEDYLSALPPTYLSLDDHGRVLRLDSFSKVLVPGARMGFVTGTAQVVERFIRYMESAQGPSGFSQAGLFNILDRSWGHEGYLAWLARLSGEYARRRDILVKACEEEMPNVVTWVVPRAGMFIWLKVDYTKHPHKEKSILEVEEEIFNSCIRKGVLVARGSWFRADKTAEPSELFFRATYAMAGEDTMREAARRLGSAIRESFHL